MKANEIIKREVHPNGLEYHELKYWRFNLPLMSDRDDVVESRFVLQPDGSVFGLTFSVDQPDYPPKPGVVRMHSFIVTFMRVLPNGNLEHKQISQGNLMGKVPKMVMNMLICNEVFKETKKMFKIMIERKC